VIRLSSSLRGARFAIPSIFMSLALACMSPSSEEQESEKAAATEPGTGKAEGEASPPADPASFPEVVATVNGTEIHKKELLDRVATIESQSRGGIETSSLTFYRRVLDDLVGTELLYQSSKAKGLSASSGDVDQQMSMLRSRMADPAAFEQALAAEGLTEERLRHQMERDMSIQKLIEQSLAPRVEVSEDEKRRFYDDNNAQMRQPDRLRVSHILKRVEPGASPESRAAARAAIEALLEEAQSGADFATLARENSEDPGSASSGGEMVIARGQTVPPFEEAAFALEPGGLSPVVETQFGFHIIKLSERMAGELVPYEQVESRIEDFLKQQGLRGEVDQEVESLRTSASVEILI
jgi:peptidyl-prolyl cis-trans isomerase C